MGGDPGDATSVGSIFQGGYEILTPLGSGSFGDVFRARQLSTGQDVAIKILRRRPDAAPGVRDEVERFRREMRLCARLSHPNIVRLIDSGETARGMLYAVFEYVPGETLRHLLDQEGKLSLPESVHLMTQVLDALSAAHASGVVHRDLKPENVMITKTGARRNALVLDFGLGGLTGDAGTWTLPRLTATHELMGTPCYAAPEQLRGEPPTTRSDLYSWGLTLLECLTGEVAVSGRSAHEVIYKQLGPDPVPIPAQLREHRLGRILEVVTAKPVEKREATVEGLLDALAHAETGLTGVVKPESAAPVTEGQKRQLTIVSCRIELARADRQELDFEEVDEVLHAQHAFVGEVAGRHAGRIASVLADRILLAFGYPKAQEDDARRAARAALEIVAGVGQSSARLEADRGLRLDVRAGIHTGLVVARELRHAGRLELSDLVGLTPQLAIRVEERAAPGEVLASAASVRLARGDIDAEPAGSLADRTGGVELPVYRLQRDQRFGRERQTIPWVQETPLVGRAGEVRQVVGLWQQVEGGTSRVVLVKGEPGIGKSRLVRELRRRIPSEAWLEARCTVEHQNTPLQPFADLLLSLGEPIEPLLVRVGLDVAETLPLVASLLGFPPDDRFPPPALLPDRRRELTLNAILALLLRLSHALPRALVLEDMQWADPTSLELATMLVQESCAAEAVAGDRPPRLLIVFTARTEFEQPWPAADVSVVQPSRLSRSGIEEMVQAALSSGRPLPGALLDVVVKHADGVPLFVEEVTRVLLESGSAWDNETSARDDYRFEIPTTLRELLAERIDRLSASARDTVQLAAVLGREFRYELLSAVARTDESLLRGDVRELLTAGLLHSRPSAPSETYVFKHALVRDAAYDSLVRGVRQALHARVANTLRERFPDATAHQPGILALHFEYGGDGSTAADYWQQAGDRAFRRAAYTEAIQQLERGLRLVETADDSPRRRARELELLVSLGTVQLSTKGMAAPEVEQLFARAQTLCEGVGGMISLKVLAGIASVLLARGDRRFEDLIPHLETLIHHSELASRITGHVSLATYFYFLGRYADTREHALAAKRLYRTETFQEFAREYGYDGGLHAFAYHCMCLWLLGYPEQAEASWQEMFAIAERSRNPYSMGMALAWGALLYHELGQPDPTGELAERLVSLANEQRLIMWLPAALVTRGGALLQRGHPEDAIGWIRQGADLYRMMGVRISYAPFLMYLAAAYRDAGMLAEGLAAVEESLSIARETFARYHEPELLRLRGELLYRAGDVEGAQASLRAALDIARRDQGKAYELRAATSLAVVLREVGRSDEARSLLAPVHGWFTEGSGWVDLRRAAALLAEMGSPSGASAAPP